MFFVAVLVGGGLLWNAVDGLAGFFINDAMVPVIGLVALLALVDLVFVGKLVNSDWAYHSHAIVVSQLPLLVGAIATALTRYRLKGHGQSGVVLAGICAAVGVVGVVVTNFLLKGAADGSSYNAVFLNQMGYADPANGFGSIYATAYNHVTFGVQAWLLAAGAALLAVAVAFITTPRGSRRARLR